MRETLFARWISLPAWVRLLGALFLLFAVIGTLQSVWSFRRHEEQKEEGAEEKSALIDPKEEEELIGSGKASSAQKSSAPAINKNSIKVSQKGLLIESDETEEFGEVKQSAPLTGITETTVKETPPPLPIPSNEAVREEPDASANGLKSQSPAAQTPGVPIAKARPTSVSDILDEVPPGAPNSPVKLAHYRFVLASTTFETSRSKENHLDRVAALERLTQVACMPSLGRTLSYREPSADPLCLAAIKRLLAINPESTTALCARDGIDSPSCYAADADTTFEVPSVSIDEEVDNRGVKANIRDVKDQLTKSMTQMRSNSALATEEKKAQLRDETVKLAKNFLSIACASRKIGVRERPTVTGKDFSRQDDPYGINDFLKEREQNRDSDDTVMRNPEELTSPEPEAFVRPKTNQQVTPDPTSRTKEQETYKPLGLVNLVSSDCQSAIDTARSVDPTIALIPCAERGFYSPRCIQSLRAARDAEKRSGGSRKEDYDEDKGFSRF
jgi:hypothetical protein